MKSFGKNGFINILFVVLLATVIVGFGWLFYRNKKDDINITQSEFSEDTSSNDWEWESATKPELGRLYFTADQNEPGMYYTNEQIRKYWPSSDPGTKPYYGKFIGLNSLRTMDGFYHFLKDPKPFSHDIYVESIDQLVKESASEFAYGFLSWSMGENEQPENAIYKIDTQNLSIEKVWINSFTGKSGTKKGVARIDSVVEDMYLLLTVYSCWECEGEIYGKMIINLSTGEETYLTDVTDFDINFATRSFSFQRLSPVKEECEYPKSLRCGVDGMMTVKKPTGQVFTQALP